MSVRLYIRKSHVGILSREKKKPQLVRCSTVSEAAEGYVVRDEHIGPA